MNEKVVVSLVRTAIEVFRDVPPSVPPRDVPLASILTSLKLKPKQEFKRVIKQGTRNAYRRLHVRNLH